MRLARKDEIFQQLEAERQTLPDDTEGWASSHSMEEVAHGLVHDMEALDRAHYDSSTVDVLLPHNGAHYDSSAVDVLLPQGLLNLRA